MYKLIRKRLETASKNKVSTPVIIEFAVKGDNLALKLDEFEISLKRAHGDFEFRELCEPKIYFATNDDKYLTIEVRLSYPTGEYYIH